MHSPPSGPGAAVQGASLAFGKLGRRPSVGSSSAGSRAESMTSNSNGNGGGRADAAFIAATLAASRSGTPGSQMGRRGGRGGSVSSRGSAEWGAGLDTTPIAPTKALVGRWEGKGLEVGNEGNRRRLAQGREASPEKRKSPLRVKGPSPEPPNKQKIGSEVPYVGESAAPAIQKRSPSPEPRKSPLPVKGAPPSPGNKSKLVKEIKGIPYVRESATPVIERRSPSPEFRKSPLLAKNPPEPASKPNIVKEIWGSNTPTAERQSPSFEPQKPPALVKSPPEPASKARIVKELKEIPYDGASATPAIERQPPSPEPQKPPLLVKGPPKPASKPKNVEEIPYVGASATSATRKPSPSSESSTPPLTMKGRVPSPDIKPRKQKPEIKSPKPILPVALPAEPKATEPKPLPTSQIPPITATKPVEPPKPPPARNTSTATKPASTKPAKAPPETQSSSIPATKPIPIPSKTLSQSTTKSEETLASSDDSFVSASERLPSSRTGPTPNRSFVSPSVARVDSLANAIVASSLASSRAASPSTSLSNPPPLPPPRRRRSSRAHIFHHHHHPSNKETSRTPSPAGPQLRATMRKPRQDQEPDEHERRLRARPHLVKKHPHKHHEGDRKRWRDALTERERKRYEAVWASNRGLYSADPDAVSSLIVRDVWNRSRLPAEVLEEVYELVDRKRTGALGKEEFVVGTWLVDQRLKGRKLPIRVSESVWRSVGVLGGIKVRKVK